MSASINWEQIRTCMGIARHEECELPLFNGKNQTEFAWLRSAYPSSDELPLRWMLEGSYCGNRGWLAFGAEKGYAEYVLCGCPEFIMNCCLIPSRQVENGIMLLAEQSEIRPPWQWIRFMDAFQK